MQFWASYLNVSLYSHKILWCFTELQPHDSEFVVFRSAFNCYIRLDRLREGDVILSTLYFCFQSCLWHYLMLHLPSTSWISISYSLIYFQQLYQTRSLERRRCDSESIVFLFSVLFRTLSDAPLPSTSRFSISYIHNWPFSISNLIYDYLMLYILCPQL